MTTKTRKTKADPANRVTPDDISDRLDRAEALAYVLADAAGGELGIENDSAHLVGLVIADEIKQAKVAFDRYRTQTKGAA